MRPVDCNANWSGCRVDEVDQPIDRWWKSPPMNNLAPSMRRLLEKETSNLKSCQSLVRGCE